MWTRSGRLFPLHQIEWQSEHLLLIGWIEVQCLNVFLVLIQAFFIVSDCLLVRAIAWDVFWADFVDQFLQRDRALDLLQVFSAAVRNVLQSVDLAKHPEDVALVLALSLDLVDFAQVDSLADSLKHVLDKLWLRQRVLVVHRQMVEQDLLR